MSADKATIQQYNHKYNGVLPEVGQMVYVPPVTLLVGAGGYELERWPGGMLAIREVDEDTALYKGGALIVKFDPPLKSKGGSGNVETVMEWGHVLSGQPDLAPSQAEMVGPIMAFASQHMGDALPQPEWEVAKADSQKFQTRMIAVLGLHLSEAEIVSALHPKLAGDTLYAALMRIVLGGHDKLEAMDWLAKFYRLQGENRAASIMEENRGFAERLGEIQSFADNLSPWRMGELPRMTEEHFFKNLVRDVIGDHTSGSGLDPRPIMRDNDKYQGSPLYRRLWHAAFFVPDGTTRELVLLQLAQFYRLHGARDCSETCQEAADWLNRLCRVA